MTAPVPARWLWPALLWACVAGLAQEVLPGTQPLTLQGDLSAQMVAGIDRFLLRETEQSVAQRQRFWQRDFSAPEAYEKSVEPNRARLRKIIGAVDARLPVTVLHFVSTTSTPAKVAETDTFTVTAVRWPVFEGVWGEGLWLQPRGAAVARIVAIPDADQTPEMIAGLAPGVEPERQFARRLAENGCEVLVPVLVNRQDTWSGSARLNRFTNQPHREWIYRQAFEMGRHIIGYEVQKVLGAVDWFAQQKPLDALPLRTPHSALRLGVAGYAEGGLIAFYAAALDNRIDAALVSGYFDSRQRLWEEPIYRNVFGLLEGFGDAEVATLISPRPLIIEYSSPPKIDGPPEPREGRNGAAPGKVLTPDYGSVEAEYERARALLKSGGPKSFEHLKLISGAEGMTTGPGSDRALAALLDALGASLRQLKPVGNAPTDLRTEFDPSERQCRQVKELEDYTQKLVEASESARAEFFWHRIKAGSPEEWKNARAPFSEAFWTNLIGRLSPPGLPPNPRTRKFRDQADWTGYEVVLDVYPDVFAFGYLLLPKDLKSGERRPVVVCQHGLSSGPEDTVNEDPKSHAFKYYKGFAAALAKQGFVVFAPQNLYRDGAAFRPLQRKANLLGKSLFSVIIAQHSRILDWLSGLPFVDPARVGFYGLSYGGTTAMRVPAALDRYAVAICSGNFNEWVRKTASPDGPASYLLTGEYEMPEFDLGHTFSHAEMAALIAPRPFMVERGHQDSVGSDEWVAYEYAKVRRFYDQLSIGDRTAIEFFHGPHTINGVGTFKFLREHLNWPKPKM